MGNYRDNRGGGGRSFGRRSFGGNRGGDRPMTKTTCSSCGKECEVPFKPTGSKPVYCNDCFKTRGGFDSKHSDNRGSRSSNYDSGRAGDQSQYKEQFETLNTKLDEIIQLLGKTPQKKPKVLKPAIEEVDIEPKPTEIETEVPQVSVEEVNEEEFKL